VIVKFSPPIQTVIGQRWSDLLLTEHLAHEVLREADVPAARSRIRRFEDRTYLEVDRFDREGLEGRIGVTSLLSIDAAFYGKLDNWIAAATRLTDDGRLPPDHLALVRLAATFGELIANTDRHFGNFALYDRYDGRFGIAPVYDMLPMLFKPEHDQIVPQAFKPPSPSTNTLSSFARARAG
jgi:serine/threonine protein kinase HipA of HipAB toxin-antitoxin module